MSTRNERYEEMKQTLAEQKASGLSIRAFAEDRGISTSTLNYWKQKLKRSGRNRDSFAEVRVVPAPLASHQPITVELLNQRKLRIAPGFDANEVVRLIEVLESC